MTDDELHAAWIAGHSLDTIADRARTTKHTIGGRVRRLRASEGLERWPYHGSPIKRRAHSAPKRIRPGRSTLPPLASLEGHGETPRR